MYDSCKPTDYMAHQAPLSKDFPSKITGVGCHFLLQGIFLTQGYNLGLLQAVSCIAGIFFIDSDSKDTYIKYNGILFSYEKGYSVACNMVGHGRH